MRGGHENDCTSETEMLLEREDFSRGSRVRDRPGTALRLVVGPRGQLVAHHTADTADT